MGDRRPTYRLVMKDKQGHLLTRRDLQNPAMFAEATSVIPNYPAVYNYTTFAHVRIAKLPLQGLHLRVALDKVYPGWDEAVDWSLLLERESFLCVVPVHRRFGIFSGDAVDAGLVCRPQAEDRGDSICANMLHVPVPAFFGAPEIKQ